MTRPRIADDFATIRGRMEELRREREYPRASKATYSGTRRRNAPEACAGRLQRLAQGWEGFANPVQATGRSGGVLPFRPPGAKRRKRLLFGPRNQKGPVDCVHQFGTLRSAARNARASRHPSAAAARPYGTATLRGPAATDPDTPARGAASGRRPAAS
jgi:hypothetical protein